MRPICRVALIASAVMMAGVCFTDALTRAVAPLVAIAIRGVSTLEQWRFTTIGLDEGMGVSGLTLRLSVVIPARARGPNDGAVVIATVTSGAGMQIVVVFWSILLAVPARSLRSRVEGLALGIPLSLCLVALSSILQLLTPCYAAAAVLAGHSDSITLWERASNVLESGGRVVLSAGVALSFAALARRGSGRSRSVQLATGSAVPFRSRTARAIR